MRSSRMVPVIVSAVVAAGGLVAAVAAISPAGAESEKPAAEVAEAPADAAVEAVAAALTTAVTGTATCDEAAASWVVDWTLTNTSLLAAEVRDIVATPPAGASELTGLTDGDTLPAGGELSAKQTVHAYGFTHATLKVTAYPLGAILGETVTGTVTLTGECGQPVLPEVRFAPGCTDLSVHLALPAGGAPMEVVVRDRDGGTLGTADLEPGGPEQVVTVDALDDVDVVLYGIVIATGGWDLPSGCNPPVSGRIGFFAQANLRYITPAPDGVVSASTYWFDWLDTKFDVYELGGDRIALRSAETGLYVTTSSGGAGPLAATATSIGSAAERFVRVHNSDGSVSLRSVLTNLYVTAEKAGVEPLIANRAAIGPWERFETYEEGKGPVAFNASVNGKWVTAESAGTLPLMASRSNVASWQFFTVVDQGDGIVALRSRVNGLWVCADGAGTKPLIANRAKVGIWETFRIIENGDGTISFQATINGRYVSADGAGTRPLIANRAAIGAWEKFVDTV